MAFTTISTLQNIYRYKTTNPATSVISWTQSASNNSVTYNMLSISGQYAIASGTGTGVWYSSNGGQTWTKSATANILSTGYYSLGMLSGQNGLVALGSNGTTSTNNNQRFFRTSDGGATWTNVTQGDGSDRTIAGLFISGSNGLYASIAANNIYYSTNAGSSWTVSTGPTGAFDRLHMSGSYALAACSASGTNKVAGVHYSSNGGQSWTKSASINLVFVTKLQIDSSGIGLVTPSTGSTLYRSSDGGVTWIANLSDGKRICALSGNKAVAIATDSSLVIKYSNDKGSTWSNANNSARCSSVSMEGNICIAITSAGDVIYSTDGGINWTSSGLTGIVSLATNSKGIIGKTGAGAYYSNAF